VRFYSISGYFAAEAHRCKR